MISHYSQERENSLKSLYQTLAPPAAHSLSLDLSHPAPLTVLHTHQVPLCYSLLHAVSSALPTDERCSFFTLLLTIGQLIPALPSDFISTAVFSEKSWTPWGTNPGCQHPMHPSLPTIKTQHTWHLNNICLSQNTLRFMRVGIMSALLTICLHTKNSVWTLVDTQ